MDIIYQFKNSPLIIDYFNTWLMMCIVLGTIPYMYIIFLESTKI